jgi:hypothetical protein
MMMIEQRRRLVSNKGRALHFVIPVDILSLEAVSGKKGKRERKERNGKRRRESVLY